MCRTVAPGARADIPRPRYSRTAKPSSSVSGRDCAGLLREERAELLERRSRACYLTDDSDEAIEAAEEALELRRALGQTLDEGESLTWLSNILYCPGRMAESAQAARRAGCAPVVRAVVAG